MNEISRVPASKNFEFGIAGIDEVSQRKGHGDLVTVVSDIDLGELIEVIDSHKQEEIIKILKQQPLEIREKAEEVSVDTALFRLMECNNNI